MATAHEIALERIEAALADDATELDLSNLRLTALPASIGKLTKLTSLDVSNNDLRTLPESLGKLIKLTSLDVSGSELKALPESLGMLTTLTSLDVSYNELETLPEWLGNLSNLTSLNVSGSELKTLPEFLGKLINLMSLNVTGNKLKTLPEFLGRLTNLTSLSVCDNQLRTLPELLGELTNLTLLDVSYTQLKTLPRFLGKLTNLMSLDVSGNKLNTLPEFLGSLINLTLLSARDNQLRTLPELLGELTNLTYLDLCENNLKAMPESVLRLPKLDELYFGDNPVESLPAEFIPDDIFTRADLVKIRSYLDQLEREGTDYLYEAKLLIVGEPEAGKTTLARKIEDNNCELRIETTTKGIVVKPWMFKTLDGHDFRLNIWDFGGQEIYQATHQFFLTKRSLYALVIDDRKENENFDYWMNVVDLLSAGSPLLVVKNEKNDRKREIPESQLRERFLNFKSTIATNFADNRGLDQLLKEIKHYAETLPHIGTPLPKTWVKVRKALEENPKNYIDVDEFFAICAQNGFTDRKEQLVLSGYLHDLGVCLHFQDDPVLSAIVILKPKWGTDAVYKALDDKGVNDSQGRFTREDLKHIWTEPEYTDMHFELLQLMINFKLCYQIPNCEIYIAPQLLSGNRPEYSWDESDNLLMRYTYEFMPKGISTQFIVAMHPFIAEQRLVWRSGVVIEKDKTRAEVIEFYDKRMITIRVAGEHKRDLLTIISHQLEQVHAAFNNPKSMKLIPCNCSQCRGSQNPHFYQHTNLLRRSEARVDRVQCDLSFLEVSVWSLLNDVSDITRLRELLEKQRHEAKRKPSVTTDTEEREIYISYKWGGTSQKVADSIESSFASKGIQIVRDKNAVEYTGSIEQFMRKLAKGKCVVVVIGSEYLRSENCMFELVEIFKKGNARERILPVVLLDSGIYDPIACLEHKTHWDNRTEELRAKLHEAGDYGQGSFRKSLDRYKLISMELGNLTETLRDMNALSLKDHKKAGFADVIKAVEKKLALP